MDFPSKLIGDSVEAFSRLPGIGKKTALRLTLHLLKQSPDEAESLAQAVVKMRKEIKYCQTCHNISDNDICSICSNTSRNHQLVCVVETMRDVLAIEATQHFNGTYHVLGGVISPLEGIGPERLQIESLNQRVKEKEVREIIMALSANMEGDTTVFYVSKKLSENYPHLKISTLARGVAFGGELQYVDEITLSRALSMRRPYENYLVRNNNS